jgi:stage V sporulation protein S
MDRFYSSLDLREIKVGPESSFPPDAEAPVENAPPPSPAPEAPVAESVAETAPPVGNEDREVLKVSAKSRPSAVAGAIAGVVRETRRAEVQAIGAGATNQAIKAIAIARDYVAEDGIDVVCIPEFIDVVIENEERTAIRFIVEPR